MLLLEVSSHPTYVLTAPGTPAQQGHGGQGTWASEGGHPPQAKDWEPGAQPWSQGGFVWCLAASLINTCFLEEGERWGRWGLPSHPSTWAPKPAKQVKILFFCNKEHG